MSNGFDEIKEALANIKPEEFKWADKTGIIAEEVGEIGSSDTITLDSSMWNTSAYTISTAGATGSTGQYLYSGMNGTNWGSLTASTSSNPSSLSVKGNADFEGDVKIKGVSLAKTLEDINSRLAILVPDPAKLEHFEALKKAYNHYKMLEALCELPTKDTEK
jgi:hypothetical protein